MHISYDRSGGVRGFYPLNPSWKFCADITGEGPASSDFDDRDWQTIDLPHTWNAFDGQDGGNDYLRTACWYRKEISWQPAFAGKQLFLEFLGVSLCTECYINGQLAGTHKGGFTAFRFDITPLLQKGKNLIAVKADNRKRDELAPQTADFTFGGGIYRDVNLLALDPLHIAQLDHGSSGVYWTPFEVTERSARVRIRTTVVNEHKSDKTVRIHALIKHPISYDPLAALQHTDFDSTKIFSGETVCALSETVTIPQNGSYRLEREMLIERPHLWDGRRDPYCYTAEVQIFDGDALCDAYKTPIGLRNIEVTKEGFFLNGKLTPLRGVCRHQDWKDKGFAIGKSEHETDFAMIYEIGANSIRLAHYPQEPYFYELCDRHGLLVWAEIPFVDRVVDQPCFHDTTLMQLKEMIRQRYNHPSIFCWGLQNEVWDIPDSAAVKKLMVKLNDLAHKEDPTRLTTQATNRKCAYAWPSDLMAWNLYPGWYSKKNSLGPDLDRHHAACDRPVAVSEYGSGANIAHHKYNPSFGWLNFLDVQEYGPFHPEEYQCENHAVSLKQINERPHIWGTFLWNMFDFSSDGRDEGSQRGINDKGLVTHERAVKKDAFFLYQANWSNVPMVHINSRRFTPQNKSKITVKCYSNCDSVELYVNGTAFRKKACGDLCTFEFKGVRLQEGLNIVEAFATKGDITQNDRVEWVLDKRAKQKKIKAAKKEETKYNIKN